MMATFDFGGSLRRKNPQILNHSVLGPFCYWIWRLLLLVLVLFCLLNLIIIVAVLFERKAEEDEENGPNGIVHRKLEDIIFNKVHGESDLFADVQEKVARTKFLILSYSRHSLLADQIGLEDKIFMINVNEKVRDHNPSLDIYWGSVSRTNIATALSLIR